MTSCIICDEELDDLKDDCVCNWCYESNREIFDTEIK